MWIHCFAHSGDYFTLQPARALGFSDIWSKIIRVCLRESFWMRLMPKSISTQNKAHCPPSWAGLTQSNEELNKTEGLRGPYLLPAMSWHIYSFPAFRLEQKHWFSSWALNLWLSDCNFQALLVLRPSDSDWNYTYCWFLRVSSLVNGRSWDFSIHTNHMNDIYNTCSTEGWPHPVFTVTAVHLKKGAIWP